VSDLALGGSLLRQGFPSASQSKKMAVVEDDKTHPGTVKLIDATGELHTKHAQDARDIVLIPTPSGMTIR